MQLLTHFRFIRLVWQVALPLELINQLISPLPKSIVVMVPMSDLVGIRLLATAAAAHHPRQRREGRHVRRRIMLTVRAGRVACVNLLVVRGSHHLLVEWAGGLDHCRLVASVVVVSVGGAAVAAAHLASFAFCAGCELLLNIVYSSLLMLMHYIRVVTH